MVKYATALRWLTLILRGMFEMVSVISFTDNHSALSHILVAIFFMHHHHLWVSAVGFHHYQCDFDSGHFVLIGRCSPFRKKSLISSYCKLRAPSDSHSLMGDNHEAWTQNWELPHRFACPQAYYDWLVLRLMILKDGWATVHSQSPCQLESMYCNLRGHPFGQGGSNLYNVHFNYCKLLICLLFRCAAATAFWILCCATLAVVASCPGVGCLE